MRATVRDVASLAGVSPKTVSNVINGGVAVRPATRKRVEDAVIALDYVPNLSARGLRNGKTGAIALALPDLSTPYSAEMAYWFVEVAHELGWTVQLEQTGARPERERELLSRGQEHLVDGLVLNPVTLDDSAIIGTASLPPVVVIGEVQQSLTDQVRLDSVAAARDMTDLLLSRGFRRIAVVGTSGRGFDTAAARDRTTGYRAALAAAGILPEPMLEIPCRAWTPAEAAREVGAFLASGEQADALFCFTDSLAIGALSAIAGAGLRVPDDIAVAGFDDISDGRFTVPPLTTVSFDKRLYVERTLGLLSKRIADRSLAPSLVVLPHTITVRASTGQPA